MLVFYPSLMYQISYTNLCYIILSRNDMPLYGEGNERVGVAIQEASYNCKTYEK